jgi:NAD(P)-dependent dehydrogenase (short-subunit alcohol dehydrogenase family)
MKESQINAVYEDLARRVVVITGGGQGIGRAYALAFARAGAIPVIADINAAAAADTAREIDKVGGRALALETDVSLPASVEAMASRTLAEFGRLDVLVNNAGLYSKNVPPATEGIKQPFDQIPLEEWDRYLRVNVTGAFLCARAAVPAMRKAQWGRIINTSSTTVLMGLQGYLHYVTSKAAIIGMTRALARELGKDGITVNTIMPGLTHTEVPNHAAVPDKVIPMQCIPRKEVPEDLVPTVLFLASEGSRFMTGQTLNVDGGSVHV